MVSDVIPYILFYVFKNIFETESLSFPRVAKQAMHEQLRTFHYRLTACKSMKGEYSHEFPGGLVARISAFHWCCQVWSLVGELRSHKPCAAQTKTEQTNKQKLNNYIYIYILSSTIYKNKLKMNQRPKCKAGNHKTMFSQGKTQAEHSDINHSNIFLNLSSQSKENKSKNRQRGPK